MPNRGPEVSYELRCCIVCLRCLLPPPQNTFNRIGTLLSLQPNTCQRIWQHAQRQAASTELREVLACVGRLDRSGRPPAVVDGTNASVALRALILQSDDLQLQEIAEIWKGQTGQDLARSTVERIAHDHRDAVNDFNIVRGVRPLIPALSFLHFDDRDCYCQWALLQLANGAIFIYTDESMVEVGGTFRKKPKISRPRGQVDTFKRALPVKKTPFNMMIWGAVCAEWFGRFPFFVWDDTFEDAATKEVNAVELIAENAHRREKVEQARVAVHNNPASVEARALREINGNVQHENNLRKQKGQRGRLHTKTAAQIYPYDDLKRDHKKNGIDWFLYRQQILRPILYPYYFAVKAANPGREVWLIEDRASPHQKAYNIEQTFREVKGIKSVIQEGLVVEGLPGWPGKSPDLNMIEPCWSDLKDECHPSWRGVQGQSFAAKAIAAAIIATGWRAIEEDCRNHARGCSERLNDVLKRDGNNNVRG